MEFDRVVNESGLLVGYVTDVEGNLSFWNRYIEHSSVLSRLEGELILKDNCQFVYGGDSCDRGCGDLQVLQDLIALKERYPECAPLDGEQRYQQAALPNCNVTRSTLIAA